MSRQPLLDILAPHHGQEHINGLDQGLADAFMALMQGAPPEVAAQIGIISGYRSVERQQQLWDNALKKYGSPEKARKWVAPPGNSMHNHGGALDLRYGNSAARDWVHANAGNHNLHFPMSWEPWHIELKGSRGGHQHDGGPHRAVGGNGMAPGAGTPMADGHRGGPADPARSPAHSGSEGGFSFGDMIKNVAGGFQAPQQPTGPQVSARVSGSDPSATAASAEQLMSTSELLTSFLSPDPQRLNQMSKRPQAVAGRFST